jgi:hypothetical protein
MTLNWEKIKNAHYGYSQDSYRAKVPGGWLVMVGGNALTFLPDPNHEWDGNSLR